MGAKARAPGAIHKSDRAAAQARRLRREPTYAEKQLWKLLRTTDLHFRRQAPFGRYVVDFVCHRYRLVVELDGGVHNLPSVAARDAERELFLASRGYQVMRFLNTQSPEDILSMIVARISADTPTPNPSPQGGRARFSGAD